MYAVKKSGLNAWVVQLKMKYYCYSANIQQVIRKFAAQHLN